MPCYLQSLPPLVGAWKAFMICPRLATRVIPVTGVRLSLSAYAAAFVWHATEQELEHACGSGTRKIRGPEKLLTPQTEAGLIQYTATADRPLFVFWTISVVIESIARPSAPAPEASKGFRGPRLG